MLTTRMVVAVAIAAGSVAGCGGRETAPLTIPPAQALASWSYVGVDGPVSGGTSVLRDQCLSPPLPLGSDGDPDCVFIRALFPHGTQSADVVASCQQCSSPGESPVPAAVPLASFDGSIATYDCLCVVEAQPPSAPCPPPGGFTAASTAAWCYAPSEPGCGASTTPAIEFSPAASQGAVLFGACFAPGTVAVTYAQ